MLQKQQIDKKDINEWKEETWKEYAALVSVDHECFRFLCNFNGKYRVTRGNQTKYLGDDVDEAIKAWGKL